MVTERKPYLAYMLRLWQTGEDGMTWRASLENAHTGARQGFAGLNALFAFLEEQTGRGVAVTPSGAHPDSEPRSGE